MNDALLDDSDPDDPENFVVRQARQLLDPALQDGTPALSNPDLHYLRYDMRPGRETASPPEPDGDFARPAQHLRRIWQVQNAFGRLDLRSLRVEALLVPAAASLSAPPAPPSDATHYVCYRVVPARGAYTAQTPGRCAAGALRRMPCQDDADCGGTTGEFSLCARPRFRGDLQSFLRAPLFDDCAVLADGVTPSFAGTPVEGACLFALRPAELCNPVETEAVEPPRETSAVFAPSMPTTAQSLLCYSATSARRFESPAAAALVGAPVGSAIVPEQAAHVRRTLRSGAPVQVAPGNELPGPTVLETTGRGRRACIPTDVLGASSAPE